MNELDIIEQARAFATAAHAGQLRKYVGTPYVTHPIAVAEIVAGVPGATPAMICAALLHDVVEDTDVTLEQLEREFGAEVASLVDELTDISRLEDGIRAVRKGIDRAHSAAAGPEGQTIKLADLIHNSGSIAEHDPAFAAVYMAEKRALLEVLTKGHPSLREKAWQIVHDFERHTVAAA